MDYDRIQKNINNIFSSYGSIEKKIHVSWKNKNIIDKHYSIIQNGILQLKNLNPDYEFTISDDADIEAYLQENLSMSDYQLIKPKKIVEKTDLWRLFKIYNEGGIYMDIDRLCNIPLSSIIKPDTKCILPLIPDFGFAQDIMISCSKNIIFKLAIHLNIQRRRNTNHMIIPTKIRTKNILDLGPGTYMNAITKVLFGKEINLNPGNKVLNYFSHIIVLSPYLETYKEDSAYNTILYQGEPVVIDKDEMYRNESVQHWAS